jgi:putative ABC transport system permease protein
MLKRFVPDPVPLRAAQAVGAAIFALIVAYFARRSGFRLLSEAAVALVRGISQIIVVGLLLTLVLGSAQWLSAFVLLGICWPGRLSPLSRPKTSPVSCR